MKPIFYFFPFSVLMMFNSLFASPKTDSIVAFLGGAHAKFVWFRWAWCNDNYTPKTQDKARSDGYSLMLMDTREGTERTLVTGLNYGNTILYSTRISRSGKWVTYMEGTQTIIVDLTVPSPQKKVFLDKNSCTYWAVRAMWIDPANGTEYAFCLNNAKYPSGTSGRGIYKVKINTDGTADRASAQSLTISGNPEVDEMFSVSADGRKLGGAFPWPNCKILDIPTGTLIDRHAGGFGCQPNIAPDNSYRFYHCEGDHLGVQMFGTNLQDNTNWFVNLGRNLAGNTLSGMDFAAPRWTNHVQYLTGTWPMGDNYDSYCGLECGMEDNGSLWSKSASWVQNQINMLKVPKFYLGKFSSDFKSQEKSILIASDQRYFQYGGDGWICNGTTYGNQCSPTNTTSASSVERLTEVSISQNGGMVNVRIAGMAKVQIIDAQGKVLRMWKGRGDCTIDIRSLAPGAYLALVTITGKRNAMMRLPLTISR